MLSNLKTRFERNLIYVSHGAGPALGSGVAHNCLPASWGSSGKHGSPAGTQTWDLWFQLWGFYYLSITPYTAWSSEIHFSEHRVLEWWVPGQSPTDREPLG